MIYSLLLVTIFIFALADLGLSQNVYGNGAPPTIPLAVKTPYVNAWVNSTMNDWPKLWDGKDVLGWAGLVREDGQAYRWMGVPANPVLPQANVTNVSITPTQTILTILVKQVELRVTYLTPVDPSDMVVQSLPFSFMSVEAHSTDGLPHSVQIYSDVSGEWVSGDGKNVVTWTTRVTGSTVIHEMQKQTPTPFTEVNNRAEDSTLYFCMHASTPGMSWQTGTDTVVRNKFKTDGQMDNTQDTSSRPLATNYPMLTFSVDLGPVSSQYTDPVTYAVGLVRDPITNYTGSSGIETRSSYFWSAYSNIDDAIDFFSSQYFNIKSKADFLDNQILSEARNISSAYADLVSLSLRQTIAATDITVLKKSDGSYDVSDIKMFMKDTGNTGRVNPVDTLYFAYPALLYLNASYAAFLLEPIFDTQMNASKQQAYALPEIGSSYPSMSGSTLDSSSFGVDNSASMLILTLTQAKISGDGTLISKYYDRLKLWADYLVKNGMSLSTQYPNVGPLLASQPTGGNNVNLGVKAIIAVQAMSEISSTMGKVKDQQTYQTGAKALGTQWKTMSMSAGGTHMNYYFNQTSSEGIIYNLYAEKLLKTNLFDSSVYDNQTSYLRSMLSSNQESFGLPADSDSRNKTRSDWSLLTSSTAGDANVISQMISQVRGRAFIAIGQVAPFPLTYDTGTGTADSTGFASPAQGAMYSHLALNIAFRNIVLPTTSKKINAGAIAGGAVGGVVGVGAIIGLYFILRRQKQRKQIERETSVVTPLEPPSQATSSRQALSASSKENYGGGQRRLPDVPTGPFSETSASSSSGQSPLRSGSRTSQENILLRTELHRLRRDVEEIRRGYDAPPQYDT